MPKSTGKEWFGAPAAAEYLGIYLTTLYRLIEAGDVPAYKFGRVIRLRRDEVDAFIDRSRVAQVNSTTSWMPPATRSASRAGRTGGGP